MKTSPPNQPAATMKNGNVHVLFHKRTQRRHRYDRRHFHQLFRRLRQSGTRRLQERRDEDEILGTSIACSGIRTSSCQHISTSWFSICGAGISRIWTSGTTSAMCSTMRSWTRSCGPCGSAKLAGRTPFSASSSSNSWKNAWGGGVLSPWRVVLVLVPLLPGPGHHRAACAVVHLLGHPLMPSHAAEGCPLANFT